MTLGDHEAKRAGIGEPVRRKEDIRFVSGEGAFGDTWIANEQAYALMVRSPHAHAKILGVNCEEALLKQGVLAVLTGADAAKDGMKLIPLEEANRLPYGLASHSVYERALAASAIETGMLSVNHYGLGLPELPFGGVKDSGFGSEGGPEAVEAYLATKLVSQAAPDP